MRILYCLSEHHRHSESVDKKHLAIAFYSWNLEKIYILFPESIFIINDRDDW